jgi:hypothetical protein
MRQDDFFARGKRLADIFAKLTGVFHTLGEISQSVRTRYQYKLQSQAMAVIYILPDTFPIDW